MGYITPVDGEVKGGPSPLQSVPGTTKGVKSIQNRDHCFHALRKVTFVCLSRGLTHVTSAQLHVQTTKSQMMDGGRSKMFLTYALPFANVLDCTQTFVSQRITMYVKQDKRTVCTVLWHNSCIPSESHREKGLVFVLPFVLKKQ